MHLCKLDIYEVTLVLLPYMPGRMHIFENNAYYHIYNKAIDEKKPFSSASNCNHFLQILWFYRSEAVQMKLSNYLKLSKESQDDYAQRVILPFTQRVSILAYCLMPNHYHLLIKQVKDHGISIFLSFVQNAFTRYYNVKSNRVGQVFLQRFKSKPISSEETLKHVARYIHLNPYSAGIIKKHDEIFAYPWSSLTEVRSGSNQYSIANSSDLLSFFDNDLERYQKFLIDNADYQRSLEEIKHIEKWQRHHHNHDTPEV